ncbi:MAG: DoxX family protein [Dysgonamonadaceae bacterium]|jgi:uncharacterized membrane protein YphA (DoxX/SURF4 family)|nr:DoxX family protein [Dysgonamonadaceae bacterium]
MKSKIKKLLIDICRWVLGIVFLFSGFVKAIDPLGGTYKTGEYLTAFRLDSFAFFELPISVLQAAVEFTVGVCLLLNVYRKNTAIWTFVIMAFMTALTFYLVVMERANQGIPMVTDCGCFGDAITLTNKQTFLKNIVLLVAAFILLRHYQILKRIYSKKYRAVVVIWAFMFSFGLSYFCYKYLPLIDFRPYTIGTNIKEKMQIPEGAAQPEYETTLVYAKNGKERMFSIDNYPKDTTWIFVDSKSVLINEGYVPPIHDFSITTENGEDITEHILNNPSYSFLLISNRIKEAKRISIEYINEIYTYAQQFGYEFYALTSSLPADIYEWVENSGAEYPFCTTDETTLKTIIRSNPGLLLIKGGTILNKWSANDLPDIEALNEQLDNTDFGEQGSNNSFGKIFVAVLIFIIPLIVLYLYNYYFPNIRKHKHKSIKDNHYLKHIIKKQKEEELKHINQQLK